MNHSVINIFSLFQNIKRFVGRKKDGDINLDVVLPSMIYEKCKPYLKKRYKELWNEYANYFFTYEQLKLYILYENLFRDDVIIINIDSKEIKNINNILSEEQYQKDKILLKGLNKNLGYESIKSFFLFNEEGENVIYKLTIKKVISPMVYIKFIDEIENKTSNEEYRRFTKIIKKIKQLTEK